MVFLIEDALAKTSGVYLISNDVTNEVYIGATKSLRTRFVRHRGLLRGTFHENKAVFDMSQRVGIDNIKFSLLESVEAGDNMKAAEQRWIVRFSTDSNFTVLNGRLDLYAAAKPEPLPFNQ